MYIFSYIYYSVIVFQTLMYMMRGLVLIWLLLIFFLRFQIFQSVTFP